MAEPELEYIREKSLETQAPARERARHGGWPNVADADSPGGRPVPEG